MRHKSWPPPTAALKPLVRALARIIEEDDYRKAREEHRDTIAGTGDNENHDNRFALIDRDGDPRYAAIIHGTFQIGKERATTPAQLEDFARAILIDGKDGRF